MVKIRLLMLLYIYAVFLISFKTNHGQIHKSTPLLSIFTLKV